MMCFFFLSIESLNIYTVLWNKILRYFSILIFSSLKIRLYGDHDDWAACSIVFCTLQIYSKHHNALQTLTDAQQWHTRSVVKSLLYGSNEVRNGAQSKQPHRRGKVPASFAYMTEQDGAEASQHMVHGCTSSTVLSLFRGGKGTLHFPGVEGNIFFLLSKKKKKRQHFLSQNNLSLCLTRRPAIFTQLKFQMIYFQLHFSGALWHMFLSIRRATVAARRCQSSETLGQAEGATAEDGKIRNRRDGQRLRNLVGTNSYFLGWMAAAVRGNRDTHQSKWNYCAFIKPTAGLLKTLKAAARRSPPTLLPYQNIAAFPGTRRERSIRLWCSWKSKQIDQSVKHESQLLRAYLRSILSLFSEGK